MGYGEAGKIFRIQASQFTRSKLLWIKRKQGEEADEALVSTQ